MRCVYSPMLARSRRSRRWLACAVLKSAVVAAEAFTVLLEVER